MNEYISSGKAAELMGITRRTLIRWEEQGILESQRDKNGNRYYSRDHVLVARRVSDQWKKLRRLHREHLRKLPAIQKEIERFISTKPLERTRDPEPLNFEETKAAFKAMRDWEQENKRIHKLYHEFYQEEILKYHNALFVEISKQYINE